MSLRILLRMAVLAMGPFAMGLLAADPAAAATITVNSVADDQDGSDGECTLREAITSANSNLASGVAVGECVAGAAAPTVDQIAFDATAHGTISPATNLPAIGEIAHVDGAGAGEVRLDGTSAPAAGSVGLTVLAGGSGSTIEDLTITKYSSHGINISGTDGVSVLNNLLGTDAAGSAGLGNALSGVRADIGTTGASIDGNVIAGSNFGITVRGAGTSDVTITGNRIGTNPAGTTAIANSTGIDLQGGVDDVRIGGPGAERNLISGNSNIGFQALATGSARSAGIEVLNNRIGTTSDGLAALPNANFGVILSGGFDDAEIQGNLVSGNGNGIIVSDSPGQDPGQQGPTGVVVAGNRVGVDRDGVNTLFNGAGAGAVEVSTTAGHAISGVVVGGTDGLTPGGPCTGDCNVIAEDVNPSLTVSGPDTGGTAVLGNHIGVDVSGTVATDAGLNGIYVSDATGTTIGSPAAPNVIGEAVDLIELADAPATAIQANVLGSGSDLVGDFGAGNEGVQVNATDGVLIGGAGPGEGNTIAHSNNRGIRVLGGSDQVAMLGNEIFDHGGLGIDLEPIGVTANDVGVQDADTGENGLQNFPDLDVAVTGGVTHVTGSLDSAASTDFRLEFFGTSSPDGSGHGEGDNFLGATTVTTNAAGLADFLFTSQSGIGAGNSVSATATELDGSGDPLSTSEFATNVVEGGPCDTPTAGPDLLCGTTGSDVIDGLGGDDVILGLGGGDTLTGGGGADLISGDGGADTLNGGAGSDELRGGTGDDTLLSNDGGGADTDNCGPGTDIAAGDEADTFIACETVSNDTTPPETTITTGPAEGATIATTSTSFTLASSEAGSSFTCSVDGAAATPCSSPLALSGLSEGQHSLSVTATDAAGNVDPTAAVRSYAVDSSAPVLALSGDKKQKSKKQVVVEAECGDEACDLVATGTIKVKILDGKGKTKKTKTYDLKKATKSNLAAGESTKLKLSFDGKTKKKVAKVIKKKKSKAKVYVTATDAAGNETGEQKFKVTVKK